MPGFICAHHHFYSAFARGISIPGEPPRKLTEILDRIWWKLDRILTHDDIYHSSLLTLTESIKHGVTTIFDHHESQGCQNGSLDAIERAVHETGVRVAICLGTSDRYGKGKEGIRENRRFIEKLMSSNHKSTNRKSQATIFPLVGLHASFTVSDDTLHESVALADEYDVGIHIHCAEDFVDPAVCFKQHGVTTVERLARAKALSEKTILAHCIHVDRKEISIIKETGANVVHNPESNMNNAVGRAPVLEMLREGITVGLGTDGMSSNMLSQMRTSYLLHRFALRDPRIAFSEAPAMLLDGNPQICKKALGIELGVLKPGAPADVIILDYFPPTPLTPKNLTAHLLFGAFDHPVITTIVNGKVLMEDGVVKSVDEEALYRRTRELSRKLWRRFGRM